MLRLRQLLIAVLLLALAACASKPDTRKLDERLYLYAGAIRWGVIDEALAFIDPKVLEEKPLSAVERARYDQVQFAGYQVKKSVSVGEDELLQQVEIRVINKHTQVERTLIDQQRWRFDRDSKTWWLVSGLPDIATR